MTSAFITIVVGVVLCAGWLIALAMRRYARVKAGFHVGRSGFYIEADNGQDGPSANHAQPPSQGGRDSAHTAY